MNNRPEFPFPPMLYGNVEGMEEPIITAAVDVGEDLSFLPPDAIINVGMLLIVMGVNGMDACPDPIATLNKVRDCAFASLENLRKYTQERTN
jgi:hypothetical protein